MKRLKLKAMHLAVIATMCLFTTGLMAQPQGRPDGPPEDRSEKIEALRIAFISQKLNLTPEEAQKFWPVYNAYIADIKALHKNFKMGPNSPQPTAEQMLDFEQKKLDLKKKYKAQFEAAIGQDKVNTLYHLEEEFRQKLKELRDQRMQNKGQGPPPAGGGKPQGN